VQDCFNDLTDVRNRARSRDLPYAGDEAILTWRLPNGLKDANCVNVFFDFDAR
jgi:adenylate cyclase